ncbi:hypothetical protein [Paraburkholderia dipogonis]|uniref:hypothetical protein n=1 Tax=Paraburkholderia dipogonis TaxID=1211383 RepID=UPI0038BB7884
MIDDDLDNAPVTPPPAAILPEPAPPPPDLPSPDMPPMSAPVPPLPEGETVESSAAKAHEALIKQFPPRS